MDNQINQQPTLERQPTQPEQETEDFSMEEINNALNESAKLQVILGRVSDAEFGRREVMQKASLWDRFKIATGAHDEKRIQQAGTWERIKMLFGKGRDAKNFRLLGQLGEYFGSDTKTTNIFKSAEKLAYSKVDDLENGLGQDVLDIKEQIEQHEENSKSDLESVNLLEEDRIDYYNRKFASERREMEVERDNKARGLEREKEKYKKFIETEQKMDELLVKYTKMHEQIKAESKALESKVNKFESAFEGIHNQELKDEIEKALEITKQELEEMEEKENQLYERVSQVEKNKQELADFNARVKNAGKTSKEIREERQQTAQNEESETPENELPHDQIRTLTEDENGIILTPEEARDKVRLTKDADEGAEISYPTIAGKQPPKKEDMLTVDLKDTPKTTTLSTLDTTLISEKKKRELTNNEKNLLKIEIPAESWVDSIALQSRVANTEDLKRYFIIGSENYNPTSKFTGEAAILAYAKYLETNLGQNEAQAYNNATTMVLKILATAETISISDDKDTPDAPTTPPQAPLTPDQSATDPALEHAPEQKLNKEEKKEALEAFLRDEFIQINELENIDGITIENGEITDIDESKFNDNSMNKIQKKVFKKIMEGVVNVAKSGEITKKDGTKEKIDSNAVAQFKGYEILSHTTDFEEFYGDEEADQKAYNKFQEILTKLNFATHGFIDKEGIFREKSDLDGEASLELLKLSGIPTNNIKYIKKGEAAEPGNKGIMSLDVSDKKNGVIIEYKEGKFNIIVDHHAPESQRDTSAAEFLYKMLDGMHSLDDLKQKAQNDRDVEGKKIKNKNYLQDFINYVTRSDNKKWKRYYDEEYSGYLKNDQEKKDFHRNDFHKTLMGLEKRKLRPKNGIKTILTMFKNGIDPEQPMSDYNLVKYGFIELKDKGTIINKNEIKNKLASFGINTEISKLNPYEKEKVKQNGYIARKNALQEIKANHSGNQEKINNITASRLEEMESKNKIINSPTFGKILVDLDDQLEGAGADASMAFNCNVYIKWVPKTNSFWITSMKDLNNFNTEEGKYIKIRKTMLMNPKEKKDWKLEDSHLREILEKMGAENTDIKKIEKENTERNELRDSFYSIENWTRSIDNEDTKKIFKKELQNQKEHKGKYSGISAYKAYAKALEKRKQSDPWTVSMSRIKIIINALNPTTAPDQITPEPTIQPLDSGPPQPAPINLTKKPKATTPEPTAPEHSTPTPEPAPTQEDENEFKLSISDLIKNLIPAEGTDQLTAIEYFDTTGSRDTNALQSEQEAIVNYAAFLIREKNMENTKAMEKAEKEVKELFDKKIKEQEKKKIVKKNFNIKNTTPPKVIESTQIFNGTPIRWAKQQDTNSCGHCLIFNALNNFNTLNNFSDIQNPEENVEEIFETIKKNRKRFKKNSISRKDMLDERDILNYFSTKGDYNAKVFITKEDELDAKKFIDKNKYSLMFTSSKNHFIGIIPKNNNEFILLDSMNDGPQIVDKKYVTTMVEKTLEEKYEDIPRNIFVVYKP